MEFRCRLATPSGEITEGTYVAEDEARLRHELEEQGLYVLSVKRRGFLPAGRLAVPRRRRISRREFLVFNQELATLLKAGMPLVQSLDILRQRVADPVFKGLLDDVYGKVRAGTAMSDAFGSHEGLVPAVYAASLVAGERSGNLDAVLRRYVAYEKVIGAVRRRTLSALIYPGVLVTMMVLLVGIIVFRVIPAFSAFYANFDRELPWSTRLIVGVSDAVVANLGLLVLVLAAGAAGFVLWVRQPGQRRRFDRYVLELPWAGETIRKFATAQMARTLSTLLGGGLPLVNALEITARAVSNRFLSGELDIVRQRVQEGQALAGAMLDRGVFPDVAIKMVEVGESTGALAEMLNSLADFYDEDIETEVARFITLVEPVLLVVMGVIIALVVLALYMPIFQMSALAGA